MLRMRLIGFGFARAVASDRAFADDADPQVLFAGLCLGLLGFGDFTAFTGAGTEHRFLPTCVAILRDRPPEDALPATDEPARPRGTGTRAALIVEPAIRTRTANPEDKWPSDGYELTHNVSDENCSDHV